MAWKTLWVTRNNCFPVNKGDSQGMMGWASCEPNPAAWEPPRAPLLPGDRQPLLWGKDKPTPHEVLERCCLCKHRCQRGEFNRRDTEMAFLGTQHGTQQERPGAVAKLLGKNGWHDEEVTRRSPGSAPKQEKTPSTELEVQG